MYYEYNVQVANCEQGSADKNNETGQFYFTSVEGSTTWAILKQKRFGNVAPTINAYWLPWETNKATTHDLGADADYFFTSQMTNCRFSVLTKDDVTPKVAHIAGTLSRTKRNEKEAELVEAFGGDRVKSRRLSVSEADIHGYRGQKAEDSSSAFVYGLRNTDTGAWTFKSQIVKAYLVGGVSVDLLGDIEREPLFTF
jgi:hypothetical protein